MRMKFEDIVQYSGSNKSMNALKDHCIKPGLYFELIQRWLLRCSPKQVGFGFKWVRRFGNKIDIEDMYVCMFFCKDG